MFKIKLVIVISLILSVFFISRSCAEESWGTRSVAEIKYMIPILIKIVINENSKETQSYLFNFNTANEQGVIYNGTVTLPYSVPAENEKATQGKQFIELKNDFSITPVKLATNILVNSKITMSVNLSSSTRDVPVIGNFKFSGLSLHQDGEFLKVFSGPLMDLSHSVDIYIKASIK